MSLEVYEQFMKAAIDKARQGILKGQSPFGACIVRNGVIVSCEHNQVWKTTDITAHAEIKAIRQACRKLKTIDLSECVICSTCEPCPMCFSACHWARIPVLVYGASIKDAKRAGFNELNISNSRMKSLGKSGMIMIGDVLAQESRQLFKDWLKIADHKSY